MFYTPRFCCNCGEKIERSSFSFADSGRFCDVCKYDFVLKERLPQLFIVLMALVGIFGAGSYWRSGDKSVNIATRQFSSNSSTAGKKTDNQTSPVSSNASAPPVAPANNAPAETPPARPAAAKMPVKPPASKPAGADETVYYCGAPTRKGTPCSRRVKGGGRCWQHTGQTALLPPEKLLANR